MAEPHITIAFQYSNDDGATFSTALQIRCAKIRLWEMNETEIEANGVTGRKFERLYTYYNVEIVTGINDFDPSKKTTATADSNWTTLQAWCKAGTRRIYNVETSKFPKLDGLDVLNSSTNTHYMNLLDQAVNFEDGDEYITNGKKIRFMSLQLQTRSAI